MLYEDLFQEYKQLSLEDKKWKLLNILNEFWNEYDFYEPIMKELQNKDLSVYDLDGLYQVLMKPLAHFTEEGDNLSHIKYEISQLNLKINADARSSPDDHSKLLDQISNF